MIVPGSTLILFLGFKGGGPALAGEYLYPNPFFVVGEKGYTTGGFGCGSVNSKPPSGTDAKEETDPNCTVFFSADGPFCNDAD